MKRGIETSSGTDRGGESVDQALCKKRGDEGERVALPFLYQVSHRAERSLLRQGRNPTSCEPAIEGTRSTIRLTTELMTKSRETIAKPICWDVNDRL